MNFTTTGVWKKWCGGIYRGALPLLLLMVLCTGCQPEFPYTSAEQEYAKGNYLAAAGMFHKYANNPGPQRFEAMYYEAMSWLSYGDAKKALGIFNDTIRHCDERRLRARAIAGRARAYIALSDMEKAAADYKGLINLYPDVFPKDQAYAGLAQTQNGVVTDDGLTLQPGESGPLVYRVRIRPHYINKSDALAAMDRLKTSGVEVALSREPGKSGDEFIIQIGAFSSRARAKARADSVRALGWQTYMLPVN